MTGRRDIQRKRRIQRRIANRNASFMARWMRSRINHFHPVHLPLPTGTRFLDGQLDSVSMWRRKLTDAEMDLLRKPRTFNFDAGEGDEG